jgi:hypothetical protein
MIFLATVDAPLNGFIRDRTSTHMMIVHRRDIVALGASGFSRAALTPKAVSANEPAGRL